MKMTKTILSLIIALTMVCTMTSVGVFATENGGEGQPADNDIQMDQDIDQNIDQNDTEIDVNSDKAVDDAVSDEGVVEDTPMQTKGFTVAEEEVTRLPAPKNVKALSGFKSIKLTWDRVEGADAYNVGYWNKKKKKYDCLDVVRDTSIVDYGLKARTKYSYRVMAVKLKESSKSKKNLWYTDIEGKTENGTWTAPSSDPVKVNNRQTVNRLRIYFTMKRTKRAHGQTIKKGKRIWTEDYGIGKYTAYKKGKRLRIPRVMVKNIKASYVKSRSKYYSRDEAEFFIKEYMKKKKVGSKTKYTIWVSSYHQHLYVFKKTNGKWNVIKDWEITMGKKTTPSPTGNKVIQKKVRRHHGISWWNCYSGWNALHGFRSSWSKSIVGRLASNGCVRNTNDKAKWIYKNVPKKTRVIIY